MTQEIPHLLETLGQTADEVAAALAADRVLARRGAASFRNPLVRFINRRLDIGGYVEIPVCGRELRVTRQSVRTIFALPTAVGDFLDAFHAGKFPQIEERESVPASVCASALSPGGGFFCDRERLMPANGPVRDARSAARAVPPG